MPAVTDERPFAVALNELGACPAKGILSQTVHETPGVRVVLFHFAEGEQLSEHTASMPAIIHVLDGHFRILLDTTWHEADPGFWAYMVRGELHALDATAPSVMLLTLLKG